MLTSKQRNPAFIPALLRQFVGFGIIPDMELLEVMRRRFCQLILVGPCKTLRKKTIGRSEDNAEGRFIDNLYCRNFTVGLPITLAFGRWGLGVLKNVFIPKTDVFSRIGFAIRPFMPLAQVECIDRRIRVDFITFCNVSLQTRPVRSKTHQWLVTLIADQHRQGSTTNKCVVPGAALRARPVRWCYNQWVFG